MRTPTPPRRQAHGFTLVEVLVVAVVSTIVFLFLTRWVLTLGDVSSNGLSHAAAARTTTYADTHLATDLAAATVCDLRTGTPIRELGPTTLTLYTTGSYAVGGTGTYLVEYQVTGEQLTRTQRLVGPDCQPLPVAEDGTFYGTRVVADGLRPADVSAPVFTGYADGTAVGGCTTHTETTAAGVVRARVDGTGCDATTVLVSVAAQPLGGDGGHDRLTRSYPLRRSSGAL